MQHLHDIHQASFQNTWLTLGVFDGIHRGHQSIINDIVQHAHAIQEQVVVITFHPHPVVVLGHKEKIHYLTTPNERAEILGNLGVDFVITQTFDLNLAQLSAQQFLNEVKKRTGFTKLWVGHDFALGHNREGTVEVLRDLSEKMNFVLMVKNPIQNDGNVVSSSQIRYMLEAGGVAKAAILLGRPYELRGEIIAGDQRGRSIGIPTANLKISSLKLIPRAGVYACKATVHGKTYAAAVNIGVRPTFTHGDEITHVEAHLLDYSGDLYGEYLKLEFVEHLRNEQKFSSIDSLVKQIYADIQQTRDIILGSD
jgi:riboflavin kinase / FMN adenylyltransferase